MRSRVCLKRAVAIGMAIIVGGIWGTGCQGVPASFEAESSSGVETADGVDKESFEEIDSWKSEQYQEIVFEGDRISTEASGVIVDGTKVTITNAGTFVLSGVLENGQIVVDAAKSDKVTLVWNGAEIFCEDTCPVLIIQADKTIFYLADGTENRISDGENYLFAEGETEPDAAVFAKDDLTIKGTGSLTVNANYYDGIVCKNDLKITGGILTVNAVNQGIKGKDSLTIKGGIISVQAGDDGIKSSNEALTEEDGKEVGWVLIEGGKITIASGDDAIHAESDLTINGGNITITESYEGLEGARIYINDGEIRLYASDDGINAAGYAADVVTGTVNMPLGENDGVGAEKPKFDENWDRHGNRDGMEAMGGMSSGGYLELNGGNIYVNAGGDGIDVNGSAVMNGGVVQIDGTESGGDGALDYDGTFEINGGVLIGVGSSAMAQTISSSSTQYGIAMYFDAVWEAGSVITVQDSSGTEILSYIPEKRYSFFTFSSEELEADESYSILVNGVEEQNLVISDVITVSGNVSGMGGMRGHGGGERGGMSNMPNRGEGMTPPEGMEPPEEMIPKGR